jgi:tetrahydromethanopterin S-methyltransferase subunit G
MAIGKIYDSEEATRIQNQLNAINKPIEEVAEVKTAMNKKIKYGIYIVSGLAIIIVGVNYLFKNKK